MGERLQSLEKLFLSRFYNTSMGLPEELLQLGNGLGPSVAEHFLEHRVILYSTRSCFLSSQLDIGWKIVVCCLVR